MLCCRLLPLLSPGRVMDTVELPHLPAAGCGTPLLCCDTARHAAVTVTVAVTVTDTAAMPAAVSAAMSVAVPDIQLAAIRT